MPVMQILNALEEEAFESPPYFTSIERKKFFTLPTSLQESFDDLRTPTNKVCFLVAFGYFKARRKFFGKQFRPPDVEFVATRFDLESNDVATSAYDKQTALRHQQTILDFFGYDRFDETGQEFASREVAAKVRAHRRPKTIFLELVEAPHTLDALAKQLDRQYHHTNRHWLAGERPVIENARGRHVSSCHAERGRE